MDYKEVRKRNRIKRRGGTTEGREIVSPRRVDYNLRRNVTVLCVLVLIAVVLGVVIIIQRTV